MKLFLDSVDITEIKKFNTFGIVDGITTNPSLIAKSTVSFHETVNSLCGLIEGDVSIEVISNNFEEIIKEGEKILAINSNLVIKLPVTWDGIKACKYFSEKRHKVNMTLCFSPNQALLATKAGATYISAFVGRLDDIGEDGIQLIADIRDIYDNYKFKTKILAASIRTLDHIANVALCGADVATISEKLMSKLLDHHLTKKGLEKFNHDWVKSGMKI